MKAEEFSSDAPGTLVPIEGGVAFLPNLLPADLPLDYPLANALSNAERGLGRLIGRAGDVQNALLVQRPLMTREALKSARIEGTFAVMGEVLRHEAAGPPQDERAALDNLEVIRYLAALDQGADDLRDGRGLTAPSLRRLHSTLLRETRGADKNPGAYRTGQVLIGSQGDDPMAARFVPPPALHVPGLVDNLVDFLRYPAGLPPLVAAAVAHYQFETIHPFEDGNGRMGRLLIPLYLTAAAVMPRPLLYLSDFLDRNHDAYFDLLKGVSCHGAWRPWLEFFAEAVRDTAEDAVSRIDRIVGLHNRYRQRVLQESRAQAPLATVDLVMEKVILTASDVERFANCSNPTARAALETLTNLGIVRPVTGLYPQRWVAQELIDEAYEN